MLEMLRLMVQTVLEERMTRHLGAARPIGLAGRCFRLTAHARHEALHVHGALLLTIEMRGQEQDDQVPWFEDEFQHAVAGRARREAPRHSAALVESCRSWLFRRES